MTTVSARIVEALSPYVTDVFGLMGNGNAHFLEAVDSSDMTFTAVRHEAGAVAAADPETLQAPELRSPAPHPTQADLDRIAAVLNTARRPLLLAGRGARVSDAGPALNVLSDRLGALTATTVAARNLLNGAGHLGIAGGYGSDDGAELMAEADVVMVFGAGLNQFTTRFGHLFGPEATVIQVDLAEQATHPRVDHHVCADARVVAEQLTEMLDAPTQQSWRKTAADRVHRAAHREPGGPLAPDGRLDPVLCPSL